MLSVVFWLCFGCVECVQKSLFINRSLFGFSEVVVKTRGFYKLILGAAHSFYTNSFGGFLSVIYRFYTLSTGPTISTTTLNKLITIGV